MGPVLRTGWTVAVLLCALALPAGGQVLETRLGLGQPIGEFAEITGVGPTASVGLEFRLGSRLGALVRGGAEFLSDVQAWHYLAGLRLHALGEEDDDWRLAVSIGGGGTTFSREDRVQIPEAPPPRESQLETSWTLMAGLEVGRAVSPAVEVYVFADWLLMFTDGDTLFGSDPELVSEGFGELSSIPFGIALRWSWPQ
ncbi:MAG: hypothetical protein R3246_09310 [Acidimicrobiia bacterium]|nr:hypothetical protein [Acidimicrobiia bacterium]